jgi:hypothetical protein
VLLAKFQLLDRGPVTMGRVVAEPEDALSAVLSILSVSMPEDTLSAVRGVAECGSCIEATEVIPMRGKKEVKKS